ncbi:MAG: polymer-forming cytoskeletal protein [Candidatus Heimdallarchaeota archaeon]|nr:polymer-forming cytoskeletal protein [Candidatus Heimdallarchaeota archaeon]
MNDAINLEESLKKKLDSGEISETEYNELILKFSNLDLLSARVDENERRSTSPKKWSFTGSSVVDGEDIDVPVKVSGKLLVKGDLKCPIMKVSGKATIDGSLTVLEGLKTSGYVLINQDAKLGGQVKVSGKLDVVNNLYILDEGKVSGKLSVGANVVSGDYLKVSGKLNAESVKSTGTVKSSGTVNTVGDLIAEEFISSGGASLIGGNLECNSIEIAKRFRERNASRSTDNEDYDEVESLNDIGRFVTNLVGKIVPKILNMNLGDNFGRPPKIFVIEGNVKASMIDISYVHIKGDLLADEVIFGPEVTVDGKIIYQTSIEVPEGSEYQVEKGE